MTEEGALLWRRLKIFTRSLVAASAQVLVTGTVTGHVGNPIAGAQAQLAADELIDDGTAKIDGGF